MKKTNKQTNTKTTPQTNKPQNKTTRGKQIYFLLTSNENSVFLSVVK